MWPALDLFFWTAWIGLVGWQWFAEWLAWRYLRSHNGMVPGFVIFLRKRLYDGSDGLHFFGTFQVPGTLPMEWEISAASYALVRRGDRGTIRLEAEGAATFHKTA